MTYWKARILFFLLFLYYQINKTKSFSYASLAWFLICRKYNCWSDSSPCTTLGRALCHAHPARTRKSIWDGPKNDPQPHLQELSFSGNPREGWGADLCIKFVSGRVEGTACPANGVAESGAVELELRQGFSGHIPWELPKVRRENRIFSCREEPSSPHGWGSQRPCLTHFSSAQNSP